MSAFRTWRYQVILGTLKQRPSSITLFLVVLVRNFFSDLLPARLGTLVYVYLVTNRLGIPLGAAATSFALSFLFDIIALIPMLLLAALCASATAGISAWVLTGGGIVAAAVSLGALCALEPILQAGTRILVKTSRFTGRIGQKLAELGMKVAQEIQHCRKAGIYRKLLLISFGVRILKYGSLYVLLVALVAPLGYTLQELSIPKVFVGLCSSEMAASLPFSGFMGFGAYEGTWAVVFRLLGFERIAEVTSISHHLLTQLYGAGLGILALLLLLLPPLNTPLTDKPDTPC
jgi:hypothetical protein